MTLYATSNLGLLILKKPLIVTEMNVARKSHDVPAALWLEL